MLPWLLLVVVVGGVRGDGGRAGGEARPLPVLLRCGEGDWRAGGGEQGRWWLLLLLPPPLCSFSLSFSFSCELLDRKLKADMKEEEEEGGALPPPLPLAAALLLLLWPWLPLLLLWLLLPLAPARLWVMPCWLVGCGE